LQCCFKGSLSFPANQFEKLLLPDSLDFLQEMQADFKTNFPLSEAGTVPGGWRVEKFLKHNFYFFFFSGNFLLVVALQHQWVVELSLKFIQWNLGMAKMVR